MVEKLGNKHAFWQAFVVASVIFWMGILIGVVFERSRIDTINDFYFDSETDVFDFGLASQIAYGIETGCDKIAENSVFFADSIYKEASKLEKYDDSNKITKELISFHRRYDLLRTSLWKSMIDVKEECGNDLNTVIYLYRYQDPSLTTRATQGAMSNLLIDMKEKHGDNIILIPIAVDTGVTSLDVLREFYGLEGYPLIFVNEENKFTTLDSLKEFEKSLILN